MRRLLQVLGVLLVMTCLGSAQNFVTMTGSHIYNGSSGLLASGTILFQAVDGAGNSISYQAGGGGQQIVFPTLCTVISGVISTNCFVANTALTNPVNICFMVTVKDANNNVVLGGTITSGYACVQPATSNSWCSTASSVTTCNFDQFVPEIGGIPTAVIAPPTSLTLGGIFAGSCSTNLFVTGVSTAGALQCNPISGLGQATKRLYVDGTRTDSYTANGSIQFPFKTIMGAVTQVVTNGDNATYPYLIDIEPAVYSETIDLGNTALVNLTFDGHGRSGLIAAGFSGVQVTPSSGNSLQALSNDDNLVAVQFQGMQFNKPISFIDGTNPGHLGTISFSNVSFGALANLSFSNVANVVFGGSSIAATASLTVTNVQQVLWQGGAVNGGALSVTQSGAAAPSGFSGTVNLNVFGTSFSVGTVSVSGNVAVADYSGSFGTSSAISLTSGQSILLGYGVFCSCSITINAGSTFTNYGATVSSLTVSGGTYTIIAASSLLNKLILGSGLCQVLTGSGSPAGAVAAPVCSIYLRTDGGTSTTLYVKETGTSTTSGWVAK